ncbi:MAG: BamA/TamA family outer membrane protein, partial [Bacteroidota bacterium]
SVNEYDFFSYNYNVTAPATFFGYNTDDGVFLGGGVVIRRYGFRQKPYKSLQRIVANIALKDASFNFKYTGDFNKVFGNWGAHIDFSILAPKSSTNFFGLGNETTLLPYAPNIFYRLRYDNVYVFAALKRKIGKYQSLNIGPVYDYIKIENAPGRFLSSPEGQPYIQNFTARNYAGGRLEYKIENIDDSVLTTRGYKWTVSATQENEFKNSSLHPTNLQSEFCLYIPLINRSSIDIRAGGATLINDFEFYQANTLGGQNAERGSGYLRGYLRGRYSGRSVAYLNAELRIKLLTFHTYLFPGRLGILGFYDQGRVWNDHETSNTWHSGYGGGFWISPFALAIINVTYAVSKEEKLYSVGLGFSF